MCDPITLAVTGIVIAVASGVTSAVVGKANADAQYTSEQARINSERQYQNRQQAQNAQYAQQNAEAARKAYVDQTATANQQQAQNEVAANQRIREGNLQSEQQQASARVSAGEAGVSGLSIDTLLADYDRNIGGYRSSVNQQIGFDSIQTGNTIQGYKAQATDRINSVQPYNPEPINAQPVSYPSGFAQFLETSGDIVGIGGNYQYAKAQTSPPGTQANNRGFFPRFNIRGKNP